MALCCRRLVRPEPVQPCLSFRCCQARNRGSALVSVGGHSEGFLSKEFLVLLCSFSIGQKVFLDHHLSGRLPLAPGSPLQWSPGPDARPIGSEFVSSLQSRSLNRVVTAPLKRYSTQHTCAENAPADMSSSAPTCATINWPTKQCSRQLAVISCWHSFKCVENRGI